jgi:hypothetical protein
MEHVFLFFSTEDFNCAASAGAQLRVWTEERTAGAPAHLVARRRRRRRPKRNETDLVLLPLGHQLRLDERRTRGSRQEPIPYLNSAQPGYRVTRRHVYSQLYGSEEDAVRLASDPHVGGKLIS